MTKTTKTVLSVAILGVGGYLVWKNWQKQKSASFAGGMGPRKKHNLGKGFAGDSSRAASSVVGKRVQASGKKNALGGNVVDAQASGWLRGPSRVTTGGNGAPAGFFKPHSSGWVRNL